MIYGLPTSVEISGKEYAIRADFRVMLDIFEVLNDPDLNERERGFLALGFFYPDVKEIPFDAYQTAIERLFWFIRGGKSEPTRPSKRLIDWEQDYDLIIAPVNRIIGSEVRAMPFVHWWTFLGAFMEIGECTFSRVVSIRSQLADGKSLDKTDGEWYRRNRDMVDIRGKYSQDEDEILSKWGGVKL